MATRQNIVTIMATSLKNGKVRSDLLAINAKSWQLPIRTFDRHLKKATDKVKELQKTINKAIDNTIVEEAEISAKNGLKSDLEIELQLCKIGFGEIDVTEFTYTPQGEIRFERKPTPAEMRAALAEVWKKRGSYAAEKIENKIIVTVPNED